MRFDTFAETLDAFSLPFRALVVDRAANLNAVGRYIPKMRRQQQWRFGSYGTLPSAALWGRRGVVELGQIRSGS